MPKAQNQTQLEQARKRLKLGKVNPFDDKTKLINKHNSILSGNKGQKYNQKLNTAFQVPEKQFQFIQDDRPTSGMSNMQLRYHQTDHIRNMVNQAKEQKFEEPEQENREKTKQEIYLEIMQKSKQAKRENQMLREELKARMKTIDDKFGSAVGSALPKGYQTNQNNLRAQFLENLDYDGSTLRHAGGVAATLQDKLAVGVSHLNKLNRYQEADKQEHKHEELKKLARQPDKDENQAMRGDDDDFNQFIYDPVQLSGSDGFEEAEEMEEISEKSNAKQVGLGDGNEDQLVDFSDELKLLPYILAVPGNFQAFNNLLESVRRDEQIIVYDRLIKTNSVLVNKQNVQNMNDFIKFTFQRLSFLLQEDHQIDFLCIDQLLRCLKHQAIELPYVVAFHFNNQFQSYYKHFNSFYVDKGYYPSISQGFIVVLRAYQICFFQGDFQQSFEFQNQSYYNYLLIMQVLIYQSSIQVASGKDLIKYLQVIQLMINSSCQLNLYSPGILYGLNKLVRFIPHDFNASSDDEQIKVNFNVYQIDQNINNVYKFILLNVQKLIQFVYHYFKLNAEIIPGALQKMLFQDCENIGTLEESSKFPLDQTQYQIEMFTNPETQDIYYNNKCIFLKPRQFQINEQEPLIMKHFNPKKKVTLNVDEQKRRLHEKYQKRKQKDEFRQAVQKLRNKALLKQNKELKKSIENQKIRNAQLQRNRADMYAK